MFGETRISYERDLVHHPIDSQPYINRWPSGSRYTYTPAPGQQMGYPIPPGIFFGRAVSPSRPEKVLWIFGSVAKKINPTGILTDNRKKSLEGHFFCCFLVVGKEGREGRKEGRKEGREGRKEGREEGREEGKKINKTKADWQEGRTAGRKEGRQAGRKEGRKEGKEGRTAGRKEGRKKGRKEAKQGRKEGKKEGKQGTKEGKKEGKQGRKEWRKDDALSVNSSI